MDCTTSLNGAVTLEAVAEPIVPLVFSSPHSGRSYPPKLLSQVKIDLPALRSSEDAFVDCLFAAAPRLGAPLLKTDFPRVFVDPNREPYELDAGMFRSVLPEYVKTETPRVAAGMGTVPRIVASGAEIYAQKLDFLDVESRLKENYFPYHTALQSVLADMYDRFGCYLLIDCHSMPSSAGTSDLDAKIPRTDFVLGDCCGSSCSPDVVDFIETFLRHLGYSTRRNMPYAGGFITRNYGQPRHGKHVLQLEINRALYMDEQTIRTHAGFEPLCEHLGLLINTLIGFDYTLLTPSTENRP